LYWFIDLEGYKFFNENYIVKEIAILSSDGTQCYSHTIYSPKNYSCPSNDSTFKFQYNRHRLAWDEGEHYFLDVMQDIWKKVYGHCVYVKGLQKKQFLEQYLFNVGELHMVPSFKKLNQCILQWCEHRHGKHCARRKVYELKNSTHT